MWEEHTNDRTSIFGEKNEQQFGVRARSRATCDLTIIEWIVQTLGDSPRILHNNIDIEELSRAVFRFLFFSFLTLFSLIFCATSYFEAYIVGNRRPSLRPYFTVNLNLYFRLNFVLVSSVASATTAAHNLFRSTIRNMFCGQFECINSIVSPNRLNFLFPAFFQTHLSNC